MEIDGGTGAMCVIRVEKDQRANIQTIPCGKARAYIVCVVSDMMRRTKVCVWAIARTR